MNADALLDLRPLTIGQLFDRAFRLYRKYFFTFLGIVVITQIPLYIIQIAFTLTATSATTLNLLDQFSFLAVIMVILTAIFTQVGAATLTKAISDSYLGRKISTKEAFKRMGGTWFTLIFATFVTGLVLGGLFLPIAFISFIPCLGRIAAIVGFVLLIITAIILTSLVPPVVVLEKRGVVDSIKRAWALGKLRFWWVFGYLLLLSILSFLIIQGPVLILVSLFKNVLGNTTVLVQSIVEQTATLLLTSLFLPIKLAAITLMYFDLRIRFEGFDLMVLASGDQEIPSDASDLTTKTTL